MAACCEEASSSKHKHMKCLQAVCFLRPTRENIARIRRELREPCYGEYNMCEWRLVSSTVAPT